MGAERRDGRLAGSAPPRPAPFRQALAAGEAAEQSLDGWLRRRWGVEPQPVGRDDQRRGIDRLLRFGDRALTVEVKADGQGHKTGHVFIETVSVDKDGRPGWAFTCQADLLVYWLPHAGDGWVLDPAEVRDAVWGWTRKYPVRASTNPTYHSYGLLVPHRCLDMLALERFRWKERDDAVGRCDT